ncbi:endonuclease/exonuclease/phosphatase family protein [Paenibacillus sp. N4]|uniref:endonuclease/exonuclease/phosphatase family protein n=1 Tax=Paenibacillus vietnamensis TaxID=2590547 RepID=UPI001CD14127|nr:endonuclease/exonuclease/phosphatase family protein [Paenibacillus vietnamensis]MCA0754268.1 endonuclease/exonuclease/phosphatase family protein [Paenibacillus vietnamensis]
MELAIMSFNLRVDVLQDGPNAWPYRAAEAAQAIVASGAAIVCTQEGTFEMLRKLESLLPEFEWLGEGREGGREGEHCAIFYRRSLLAGLEFGTFGLSEKPEKLGYKSWSSNCPRICTWVKLQEQGGKEFYVFNTHLDHISGEARTKGIRLVAGRMTSMGGGLPVVLTGDFNDGPASEVNGILKQSGLVDAYSVSTETDIGCTYHGFLGGNEGEPIDYIFTSPNVRMEAVHVDRTMYNGRYPSDHYPVTVRLQL